MDEAIEQFFDHLKHAGLYDNSIIIIMGDHYGISANHYRAMRKYLDKEEITPYDHVQLQRVTLYIHIPGHGKARRMSTASGPIDIKPTTRDMLDIKTNNESY